jgi:transcriptional regulator with XRE-family HTH domain
MGKNTLGDRLKILRGGRSQTDFAREFGLIQQTYARWENNSREPSVDEILKVSHRCGVTTDWLLGVDDEKTEHAKPPVLRSTAPPQITQEGLENLILQNTELSHAAKDLGESHKQLIAINADLSKQLVEMCKEALRQKACTPAKDVKDGGGRATKTA